MLVRFLVVVLSKAMGSIYIIGTVSRNGSFKPRGTIVIYDSILWLILSILLSRSEWMVLSREWCLLTRYPKLSMGLILILCCPLRQILT